jgi:hypothetical protein
MARHEHDAYDTEPACALGCVQWVARALGGEPGILGNAPRVLNILDPMAGSGPFVRAARTVWPDARIAAVDIRPEVELALRESGANFVAIRDIFQVPPKSFESVDLIITNPSFVQAEQLVRHVWPALRDGASIVLLLACTFVAGQDRWASPEAPHRGVTDGLFTLAPLRFFAPIVPRPSFLVVDGKESAPKFEACLFVFTKGWTQAGGAIPGPVRWDRPKKPRKPHPPKVTP